MKDQAANDDTYEQLAKKYFKLALHLQKDNFNALFNLTYLRFTRGQDGIDAGNLISTLKNCENPGHGGKLTTYFQMAQTGECRKAIEDLKDYLTELDGSKAEKEELIENGGKMKNINKKKIKVDRKKLNETEKLLEYLIEGSKNGMFLENIRFKHE